MVLSEGLFGLVALGVWIYAFIDVLTTPENQCRNLPKLAWIFIVLLLFVIGAILWFVAGRPWNRVAINAERDRYRAERGATTRARVSGRPPSNPDDDEEFLAGLRKRAEEQRRARDDRDRDDPA